MKKMLLLLFIFFALLIAGSYLFFPAKIHFKKTMYAQTSLNSAVRFLLNEKNWHSWWPESINNTNDSVFPYKNFEYAVNWKMFSGDSILIKSNGSFIRSLINVVSISKDSVGFQWEAELQSQVNIFNRIRNYYTKKKLENNADVILNALKNHLENDKKVYGINIEHRMVVDTLLISTKKTFAAYPTVEQVYELVNDLKKYIISNAALQTNPPMLHVVQDSNLFKTMVAIPINKTFQNSERFIIKKMVAGKILISEIKGGSGNAEAGIKILESYMDDYHLTSPAISFQSMVTDRQKEKDSTKWITKIYYPIM